MGRYSGLTIVYHRNLAVELQQFLLARNDSVGISPLLFNDRSPECTAQREGTRGETRIRRRGMSCTASWHGGWSP